MPKFTIYKSIVDYSPKLVNKYQVSSAPSIKLFVEGEVVQTLFGMRSPDDLYYTLKSYLKQEEDYSSVWGELLKDQ